MRSVVVTVMAAVVVVACSSSGSSDATTSPPSTGAATTVAVTTTSSATSTSTSSTVAPTTTVASIDAQIDAALQAYFDAYWECGLHPATCDPSTFTAEEGTARANLTKFYADMASGGGTLARNGSTFTLESVREQSDSVEAIACLADVGIVFGPPDPSGRSTVINDRVVAKRVRYVLYRSLANWVVGVEQVVQRFDGTTSC
jgi:hypothetical protein